MASVEIETLYAELAPHYALQAYDGLAGIEVFYSANGIMAEDGCYTGPGYYWWSCQPGCLPDGDASGPFETRVDAARDALDRMEE